MNSKKEYGANSVIRQTVLFRDQIAEEMTSQPSKQHTDDDKPQDVQPVRERPSGNAGEGDYFGNQYAQRNRAKRMTDRVTREKRLREQADPLELGLSRRPSSKVVKKQDQSAPIGRFAFATLDVRSYRTAAGGATNAHV